MTQLVSHVRLAITINSHILLKGPDYLLDKPGLLGLSIGISMHCTINIKILVAPNITTN